MESTEKLYAGFWRRFAAYMIDSVILAFFLTSSYWLLRNHFQNLFSLFNMDYKLREILESLVYIIYVIIVTLTSWCYFAGMESSPLQATLGKKLLGLYVTDQEDNRINFGTASLRFFLKGLSSLFFSAGFIMAAFTAKKQALHDLLAKCLVLRK